MSLLDEVAGPEPKYESEDQIISRLLQDRKVGARGFFPENGHELGFSVIVTENLDSKRVTIEAPGRPDVNGINLNAKQIMTVDWD